MLTSFDAYSPVSFVNPTTDTSCYGRQQALTRPKNDDFHQVDDMRITSYAARYQLQPPAHNCPNAYVTNPTVRLQKHGNSWLQGTWRTEIESELRGINYLGTRVRGDPPCTTKEIHYNPETNKFNNTPLEDAPDENFGTNFNRLHNPPCTLRATGWNRFVPLHHEPQETFETPFDFFIPSRLLDKEKCRTHAPTSAQQKDTQ